MLSINDGPMATKGAVSIKQMKVKDIKMAKNSRLETTDMEIAELMKSIKEVGLLQPIGVVKVEQGYETIYGNRRLMAVKKLNMETIPVVVHVNKNDIDNDLKNLTENLQRRNISLTEGGRYMSILQSQGLKTDEIAVRLGISKNYVKNALTAFQEVPAKFREDIEISTAKKSTRTTPGKISVTTAQRITVVRKSHGLTRKQEAKLYELAKSDDRFNLKSIPQYAAALVEGSEDPIKDTPQMRHLVTQFWMSEDEHNRLYNKYVVKGAFKSMNGLVAAILRGEVSERFRM